MNQSRSNNQRLLFYGFWLLLAILQASFTELQDDEAYYWAYSRFPDWGYFDHPPMIAWLIKAGYAIIPNQFGVRLIPLLLNLFAIVIIEDLLDKKNRNLYFAIVASVAVLQLWGFVAVPDIPLIFFTALFFWCYRRFLNNLSLANSLLLGLAVSFIMYSKYQAVLVIFFTFLSNPRLIFRYQSWVAALFALLLFTPHLYWQYQHNWVSFKYHLLQSNVAPWKLSYSVEYVLGQLALTGPIVFFILLPASLLYKTTSATEKAMRYSLIGIFIFFFLSSFRGRTEANWTSPGLPAFLVLSHQFLVHHTVSRKWLMRLLPVSLLFVVIMRFEMVYDFIPSPPLQARYHAWKKWPEQLKEKTHGLPVVFSNSYQRASKYWFYSGQMSYSQNFYRNRINSYSYWSVEDSMLGKPVYFADIYDLSFFQDTMKAGLWTLGLNYDSSFASFVKVKIMAAYPEKIKAGDSMSLQLTSLVPPLYKNYIAQHPQLSDTTRIGFFEKGKWVKDVFTGVTLQQLASGQSIPVKINPGLEPGHYEMIFAINCRFYKPTHNSDRLKLVVE